MHLITLHEIDFHLIRSPIVLNYRSLEFQIKTNAAYKQ